MSAVSTVRHLPAHEPLRVGYVVKRYPRYSETFIVTEILAHERSGQSVEIFALRPCIDTHFQDMLARVRAPVNYLPSSGLRTGYFWQLLQDTVTLLPGLWNLLEAARGDDVRDVYQALVLAGEVVRKRIHHLHAHFATSATTVARLAAAFAGISYSFTAHAKDIYHETVQTEDVRRKLHDAAAAVTVSDYNLAHLRETYGESAGRVRRIYNGLDLGQFSYSEPQTRRPCIVAVGRLVEKKGFVDLINACALLASRGRAFECRIIGGGPLEAELQAQIERLGLAARIKLLGPLPQREVVRCMQEAAVFAAPCVVGADSNRDGLPTVLLEAMALGTPCVATDVTGIPEALHDGETGIGVPQHDTAMLAAAIEKLLIDAALRVRLARQARRLIEECFDSARNAEKLRAVFHEARDVRSRLSMEVGA